MLKKLLLLICVATAISCSDFRSVISPQTTSQSPENNPNKVRMGDDYFVDADRVTTHADGVNVQGGKIEVNGNNLGDSWTDSVPLRFEANVSEITRDLFRQACEDFKVSCVCYSGQKDYVNIRLGPGIQNGRSYADNVGRASPVNLEIQYDSFAFYPIVAHELGHALGLTHEQQREDRDQYVRITNDDYNHKIMGVKSGSFDFDSIMLYSCGAGVVPLDTQSHPCGSDGFTMGRISTGDRLAVRAPRAGTDLRQCAGTSEKFGFRANLVGSVNATASYILNNVASPETYTFPGRIDLADLTAGSQVKIWLSTQLNHDSLSVEVAGDCQKGSSNLEIISTVTKNSRCDISLTYDPTKDGPRIETYGVFLRASDHSLLCAEGKSGVSVTCSGYTSSSAWLLFDLNGAPLRDGDEVQLRSDKNLFLCAEEGGGREATADRPNAGPWETFTINSPHGKSLISEGDPITLKSVNNYYLTAEEGGGGIANANRSHAGAWETFSIEFY